MREFEFFRWLVAATAVALSLSGVANARQPEVILAGLHVNAGDPAIVGEVRTAMPGEVLFGTTLTLPESALVLRPTSVRIHGLNLMLSPINDLRITHVADPDFYAIGEGARVFCEEERRLSGDERRPVLENKGDDTSRRRSRPAVAFDSDVRLCLIDDEADGVFDRAFVHGARLELTERAAPIEQLAYLRRPEHVIEDRFVRFEYGGVGSVFGSVILLTCDLHSPGQGMQTLTVMYDEDGSEEVVQGRRGIGGRKPKTIEFGPVQITVLDVDSVTNEISYSVDQTFDFRQVRLIVFSTGTMGYTSYSYW